MLIAVVVLLALILLFVMAMYGLVSGEVRRRRAQEAHRQQLGLAGKQRR